MRVLLIISNNYWSSPFVKIYEEILIEKSIEYDIISWDRDGSNDNTIISYKAIQRIYTNRINKLIFYLKFRKFIVKTIDNNRYEKLVVFEPQIGILLYGFLKKYYYKKFVFDYRDMSIDQLFKRRFKKLLMCSFMNTISSPAYRRVLPDGLDYIISHNISKSLLTSKIDAIPPFKNEKIFISNIGLIRDIEANMELVEALSNQNRIMLKFIGKDSEKIEELTKNISNVECEGFYSKEIETDLTLKTDFINIYLPDVLTYSTAIANRFYKALICKRPMIVTAGSIHAEYVERYNLGLTVNNCSGLYQKILSYVESFDFSVFSKNCDLLLSEINKDYSYFENQFIKFLQQK